MQLQVQIERERANRAETEVQELRAELFGKHVRARASWQEQALRAFARDVLADWPDGAAPDMCKLECLAVEHDMLMWDSDIDGYRRTPLLLGDAAIAEEKSNDRAASPKPGPQQWISVEERLPRPGMEVLWLRCDRIEQGHFFERDDCTIWSIGSHSWADEAMSLPTHWRPLLPLPQQPQEDGK